MKNTYYVFYKDLMDEKSFNEKVKNYPSYKKEYWIKVKTK